MIIVNCLIKSTTCLINLARKLSEERNIPTQFNLLNVYQEPSDSQMFMFAKVNLIKLTSLTKFVF